MRSIPEEQRSRKRADLTAAGADILIGSTVAAGGAVTDRRNRAELNRDSNADVLRDGKDTGAIAYAVADLTTRGHNGRAAALGGGDAGLCEGGHSDRNTDRCRLIADGRTGGRFIHRGIYIHK